MPNKLHHIRCLIVLALLVTAFAGLGVRLFSIQVGQHEFFARQALAMHEHAVTLYPNRGRILDRHDKTLAMSEPTKILCLNPELIADPTRTKDPDALVARLAEITGTPADELARLAYLQGRREVWVQRELPEETIGQVEALRGNRSFFEEVVGTDADSASSYRYPGIILKDRVRRTYPNGTLAAHVLGFVRHQTSEDPEIEPAVRDDKYPVAGVELTADQWLRGENGRRIKHVDGRWREVLREAGGGRPPTNGFDVVLTIDLNIQCFVEQAIVQAAERVACDAITVLVLEPQTGDILACANWPTFDPNRLTEQTHRHTANAAVEYVFEPGSTLKPFTAALALHYRTVTLETEFDCEHGLWRTRIGRPLHDAHAYDILTVFDIIRKSSNIGIAKVAATLGGTGREPDERVAEERLYAGLRAFGFGQATGLLLPAESPGQLRPITEWSGYSMTSLPMGHEIGVTPLQLALAYGAIANRGMLMEPRLVERLVDEDGNLVKRFPPRQVGQAVSPRAAAEVTRAMEAVTREGGTAPKADIPGYTQAGKTGTSHKVIDGYYSNTVFDSTFAGFAPAADPQVVIVVTMYGTKRPSHYAGTVTAPVFAQIARDVLQYLEVSPDEAD
jgi:cell division protein FtsI (penicillin-binding protein 3)